MKELTLDQMELLYIDYLTSPSNEELRNAYRKEQSEVSSTKELEDLGYSEEEMKEINKAISDI